MENFFFYDLETSGLNPRADRIMQFAGQRTDLNLEPIGEPVNILVKMTNDTLPSPSAIMVTKITPQQTLADGVSEADFCRLAINEIFTPNTIAVGFNTVRFDDEFMRATLWRNFHDPYEWQWKDGRSRWDILDVVRLTRAIRPEGINWPFREDGVATNRLELITELNGLKHEHAHDALSDVYATIAVAKLIKGKQPKLFDFLLAMRNKNKVKELIDQNCPFLYVSGRYPAEFEKATVAFPLTNGRNGNVLVYDLRYDLDEAIEYRAAEGKSMFPIVKELCFNKCPAVAPLGVLKNGGFEKIGLSEEIIRKNLKKLLSHPEFAEKMRLEYEKTPEYPPASEPEAALYDGFLGNSDRIKVAAVRNANEDKLADFHPDFQDTRLPDLLLHYKGRNFPKSLSETEAKIWEKYRRQRLESLAPKFLEELAKVADKDDFIVEELKLYFESLAELE